MVDPQHESPRVRQLRVSLTVPDLDAAVAYYRDVVGLPEVASWDTDNGRGVILSAGTATLELLDPVHAAFVDSVEAGDHRSGDVRLAVEVDDVDTATVALARGGATVLQGPTPTPWGDRNTRLQPPGGPHLTVFSVRKAVDADG